MNKLIFYTLLNKLCFHTFLLNNIFFPQKTIAPSMYHLVGLLLLQILCRNDTIFTRYCTFGHQCLASWHRLWNVPRHGAIYKVDLNVLGYNNSTASMQPQYQWIVLVSHQYQKKVQTPGQPPCYSGGSQPWRQKVSWNTFWHAFLVSEKQQLNMQMELKPRNHL